MSENLKRGLESTEPLFRPMLKELELLVIGQPVTLAESFGVAGSAISLTVGATLPPDAQAKAAAQQKSAAAASKPPPAKAAVGGAGTMLAVLEAVGLGERFGAFAEAGLGEAASVAAMHRADAAGLAAKLTALGLKMGQRQKVVNAVAGK